MAYSKVVVKSSDRNICGGKTSWTVEIEKGHYPEAISSDIVLWLLKVFRKGIIITNRWVVKKWKSLHL